MCKKNSLLPPVILLYSPSAVIFNNTSDTNTSPTKHALQHQQDVLEFNTVLTLPTVLTLEVASDPTG